NTARMRLSPPSTGSMYTRSALDRPVAGRSATVFPILTARTRCRDGTRSPVNGDTSGECVAAGLADGVWVGGPPWCEASPKARTATTTAATPPSATTPTLREFQTMTPLPRRAGQARHPGLPHLLVYPPQRVHSPAGRSYLDQRLVIGTVLTGLLLCLGL